MLGAFLLVSGILGHGCGSLFLGFVRIRVVLGLGCGVRGLQFAVLIKRSAPAATAFKIHIQ